VAWHILDEAGLDRLVDSDYWTRSLHRLLKSSNENLEYGAGERFHNHMTEYRVSERYNNHITRAERPSKSTSKVYNRRQICLSIPHD
jgi:GH43 family beta-xylosidase